ncbi:MAG: energy transducer TonB [bacterium]
MAILVSLLAHAGLMATFAGGGMRLAGTTTPRAPLRNAAKPPSPISNVHLVELPPHAVTAPPSAPTELVSDRSARGATPITSEYGTSPLPQILGDRPSLDMPASRAAPELPRNHGLDARDDDGADLGIDAAAGGNFARSAERGEGGGARERERSDSPRRELQDPGAGGLATGWPSLPLPSSLGMGGVSFNTLEWDFAPYALEMKRRIAARWFPPIAFTQGGLFGGVSVVRFRISPRGVLDECGLISRADHSSLDTAALNAVRFSAPFAALPKDFPEPFLEVTFSFHYLLGPRSGSEN